MTANLGSPLSWTSVQVCKAPEVDSGCRGRRHPRCHAEAWVAASLPACLCTTKPGVPVVLGLEVLRPPLHPASSQACWWTPHPQLASSNQSCSCREATPAWDSAPWSLTFPHPPGTHMPGRGTLEPALCALDRIGVCDRWGGPNFL